MKNIFHGIYTGITFGLLSSILFSLIFDKEEYYPVNPSSFMGKIYLSHFNPLQTLMIATLIWALIGIVFSLGSLVFTHTRYTIVQMTIIHFLLMFTLFLPLAIFAGWFPLDLSALLSFIVIFIIVYTLIWIISYIKNKRMIYEINDSIQNRHDRAKH